LKLEFLAFSKNRFFSHKRYSKGFILGEEKVKKNKNIFHEYETKRNFSKTKEPLSNKKKTTKKAIYVIQKHSAAHLHYDFRLEIDGVLKSWAIPKGPSLNPKEKRLAIETEDHPIKYADFEGVIPEGEYGAGVVMIWDKGTFKSIKDLSPKEMYDKGEIEIEIKGKKLKGRYVLFKMRDREKKMWLLTKMKDEYADTKKDLLKKEPNSVKSGKSLEEIHRSV
jgi:bifunctional non-homologous end joining protein LigD